MIQAKIIADSISPDGIRLTTMQLTYPRMMHSEFMTHRDKSRNASSSRAIPVKRMLEMVRTEPAMPVHWGKNQPGMQAREELTGVELEVAKQLWLDAADAAAGFAERMQNLGLHKQVANRILEPFQHISVIVTATEWDNFFDLRAHPDADPNIQALAFEMLHAFKNSFPAKLEVGEWHLPFITEVDWATLEAAYPDNEEKQLELAIKVSAARCCRVSYLKHDGTRATIEEDLDLCDKLAGSRPIHASPFEHQATPMPDNQPRVYFNGAGDVEVKGYVLDGTSHIDMDGFAWSGNFKGWVQNRKIIEQSFRA